jgi:Zn-dependent protease with chaperone function
LQPDILADILHLYHNRDAPGRLNPALSLACLTVYIGSHMKTSLFRPAWILFALFFLLSGVSPAQEDSQSDEDDYIKQIENQFGVVADPEINGLVEGIRDRLIAAVPESERGDKEIIVKVLNDNSVNAFALPDGHMYLFKGLVDSCETPDMLAGVMAHEFTHILHRHHSRLAERQMRGILVGLIAMAASGEMEGMILGQMLSASMVETYGRTAEEDADRNAVKLMVGAGYDPLAYFELLQVLEQDAIHRPEPGGNYFTVHPNPDERILNVRNALISMGINVPDTIYRVHIPLVLYRPLSDTESARLDDWQTVLREQSQSDESGDDKEETDQAEEISPTLLSEYQLRKELFSGITEPGDGVYGVVAAGDKGIFYMMADSDDELVARADTIISDLGDVFLNGLRDYEVQSRMLSTGPALTARRHTIAVTTESDAGLFGITPEEANAQRVKALKDVLYFYYVEHRI